MENEYSFYLSSYDSLLVFFDFVSRYIIDFGTRYLTESFCYTLALPFLLLLIVFLLRSYGNMNIQAGADSIAVLIGIDALIAGNQLNVNEIIKNKDFGSHVHETFVFMIMLGFMFLILALKSEKASSSLLVQDLENAQRDIKNDNVNINGTNATLLNGYRIPPLSYAFCYASMHIYIFTTP